MKHKNIVALVPGFFGFGRLGNFYYFADRVAATLRGAIEGYFGGPTPVLGVSTRPTASLADRQGILLDRLQVVDEELDSPDRFHLVGHSTGGVDAELLRAERPLRGDSWDAVDKRGIRRRIATITTIAAPHYGTYLSRSNAVGFLRNPLHHLRSVPDATQLAWQLAKLAADRPLVHEAAIAGLQASSDAARFVLDLVTHTELLGDLVPENMALVRRARPPVLDAPVFCFVTAAPNEPLRDGSEERRPDSFFELLHGLTARADQALGPEANRMGLQQPELPLVRNRVAKPPPIDAQANDGVVNSTSQLLLDKGRLAALVVADHADVLGHYDRADPLTDGTPLNDGFFRSGAGFGDDQFFELYGRIARIIAGK